MEEPERSFADRVIEDLEANGLEYDFFQALRFLRHVFPEEPSIGTALRPGQESVRLHQSPTLAFPPTTLERAERRSDDPRLHLWTFGFGLTGPNGPMPLPFTEFVIERRERRKDRTLQAFLDVFHHRFLALFYRAWALNHPAAEAENGDRSRFHRHLRSLVGIGQESLVGRDRLDDDAKVFHAGHLSHNVRSQEGLESILADYFEIPARVQPFRGRWLTLPADARCRLGESESTGSLGSSVIVGSTIWECQIRFRIIFGPLLMVDFKRFLPHGTAYKRLADWVRLYLGITYEWELQLVLRKEEVKPMKLGETAFLGWTTWMVSGAVAEDRSDLLITHH